MNMVFIIAEIGINHNGSLEIAKKLIMLSKVAGCDLINDFLYFGPVRRFIMIFRLILEAMATVAASRHVCAAISTFS